MLRDVLGHPGSDLFETPGRVNHHAQRALKNPSVQVQPPPNAGGGEPALFLAPGFELRNELGGTIGTEVLDLAAEGRDHLGTAPRSAVRVNRQEEVMQRDHPRVSKHDVVEKPVVPQRVAHLVDDGVVVQDVPVPLEEAGVERGEIERVEAQVGQVAGVVVEVDRVGPLQLL